MSNKAIIEGQTEDEQTYTIQMKQEAMSREKQHDKAIIESYSSFTLRLCMMWADTYSRSDRDIELFIQNFILILIGSDDVDLADLQKKNDVGEELEFLIELMKKQHIRHNIYKLT